MNTALSFGKFLTGISKTLVVANQVIPLYQQSKPLLKNAKLFYNLVRNKSTTEYFENLSKTKNIVDPPPVKKDTPSGGPQFFI